MSRTEGHDVGGGRAVPEPPLRGRLVERSHVTGDDEGRHFVERGMMLEGMMDSRHRGNNGGEKSIREGDEIPRECQGGMKGGGGRRRGLPLREEGTERHDVGGGRAVSEPPLRGEVG